MFDFAAANRDAASLRASTLYDRTVRWANFKVRDKVWVLDQGTKVGTNPKLRPRLKRPYLVTEMFNEVNAILRADVRSWKTKIVHLCKLKRCFGKPQVVAINNREQSVNESSLISDSFDPVSPAPNRKGERGRTTCANAKANDSNDEVMVYQPRDQVTQLEKDGHSMTVDSKDDGTTVVKLLSKQHRSDKENVLPSTSRATRSTQSPVNRPILSNLTNKPTKTQKHQSRLDEIREEDLNSGQDDYMPHIISLTSSPKQNQNNQDSDDAVTLKTPRVLSQREINLSEQSTDEEIKSDDETVKSEEQDSPQYTSASSEEEEITHMKTTPKGRKELRMSQSLIMDESQVTRASKTFSASKSLLNSKNWEPSSERPSQASRITNSTQVTNSVQIKQGLSSKKNQPKKKLAKVTAKTNLDAELVNEGNKPLTRSRSKILASQNSQVIENNPQTTSADYCIIPTHSPAPSESRLTIKRFNSKTS